MSPSCSLLPSFLKPTPTSASTAPSFAVSHPRDSPESSPAPSPAAPGPVSILGRVVDPGWLVIEPSLGDLVRLVCGVIGGPFKMSSSKPAIASRTGLMASPYYHDKSRIIVCTVSDGEEVVEERSFARTSGILSRASERFPHEDLPKLLRW